MWNSQQPPVPGVTPPTTHDTNATAPEGHLAGTDPRLTSLAAAYHPHPPSSYGLYSEQPPYVMPPPHPHNGGAQQQAYWTTPSETTSHYDRAFANGSNGGALKKPPPAAAAAEEPKAAASPPPEQEQQPIVPRGKPEAMAQALAAARIQANLEELQEEKRQQQEDDVVAEPVANLDNSGGVLVQATTALPQTSPKRSKSSASSSSKKSPPRNRKVPAAQPLALTEPARPITDAEYSNLEQLMVQFCRVPLLAEFSRPVSLLHPELATAYSKIVTHPVDLGHVCRGIRRRQYQYSRDVRLDMWRVFANCVKFHSHPHNKEAVPSFVSIALHLREFFNNLWQEYMLPSDADTDNAAAFTKRHDERQRNLENSGVLVLNDKITRRTAKLLSVFIQNGGATDALDEPVLKDEPDVACVTANLQELRRKLLQLETDKEQYTVDTFYNDLVATYTRDVLEDNPSLRIRIGNRLNRLFWKLLIPLHEANSRGVTQSSVWGNIAATIWARESSKKAYWPALCLGILPPEEQREGWHDAVTERNEARLPEKLRMQLETAKRKCLLAQKRQSMSYFLVEFLGTHEFIWVRETDIVENFDPDNDPNKKATVVNKKNKRSSRSGLATVVGSKTYATALEECVWANEEYESVLQDAFDYNSEEEEQDDGEEMNYSYSLLSQSDDEADDEDTHHFVYNEQTMSMSDIDEANWLFEHEGKLDTSATGRKNAKKRAQALKRKAAEKDKKPQSDTGKTTADSLKKKKETKSKNRLKEQKREQRDLERRRKKRVREREKVMRSEARKFKRRRVSSGVDSDDDERGLSCDKRARASAIVKAYLTRMANDEDYKSLCLNGVMTMPAAMVDSTGLLGMALAFRAAAGEISMPDDGEEQTAKMKPWTAIDTTTPNGSAERVAVLEKQAALIRHQLDRTRVNTQRRKDLAREAIAQRLRLEHEIEADDDLARRNHFKKKKKHAPRSSINAASTPADTKNADAGGEADKVEEKDGDGGKTKKEDTEQADDNKSGERADDASVPNGSKVDIGGDVVDPPPKVDEPPRKVDEASVEASASEGLAAMDVEGRTGDAEEEIGQPSST